METKPATPDANELLDLLADAIAARVVERIGKQAANSDGSSEHEPDFVTELEIERRFGISRRTLQSWRAQRRGPRFVKAGRKVLYPLAELRGFLDARERITSVPFPGRSPRPSVSPSQTPSQAPRAPRRAAA